jgi:ribosomal protein S18 acetylase RimI-like enzyme
MANETENLKLDLATVEKGVQAVFKNPAYGEYFVTEVNSEVAASLLLTLEWSDWRNGPIWWIQSVYVNPEKRALGLFKGLYAHVKSLAEADESIQGLRLYVEKSNTRAQGVYTRLGMKNEHYDLFEWMKRF